jgi:hypothetical protein
LTSYDPTLFEGAAAHYRYGRPLYSPQLEAVLTESGYFSMSSSAPHLFGDRAEDFAGEVRELLASRSPEGVFWDWPGDTEIVLARVRR